MNSSCTSDHVDGEIGIDPRRDDLTLNTQARFDWALRQGHGVFWLWPEVSPDAWHGALTQIEAVVRQVLAGRPVDQVLTGDPDAFGVAAYTSGMGPLLGYWNEAGVLSADPPIEELLSLHLRHNRLRMAKLTDEALRATELLDAGNVSAVVLKGMHTAFTYFPEPATRPVSDIDLLVLGPQVKEAERILVAAGYERRSKMLRPYQCSWAPPHVARQPRTLSMVHADDPWCLDVQGTLNRHYSSILELRLDDLPGGIQTEALPLSPKARVLKQPHLTLHLAAHASTHLQHLTMVRLVELAWIIKRDHAAGTLAWSDLLAAARSIGALGYLYPALHLVEDLAPGIVPHALLGECAADAPAIVKSVLARVTPATVQPLDRCLMEERFMWTRTRGERLRQILYEMGPASYDYSLSRMWTSYKNRALRIIRGRVAW